MIGYYAAKVLIVSFLTFMGAKQTVCRAKEPGENRYDNANASTFLELNQLLLS